MPFAQIDVQVRFTTRCHDPLGVRQVDLTGKPSTRSLARWGWGSTWLHCLGVGEPHSTGALQSQQRGNQRRSVNRLDMLQHTRRVANRYHGLLSRQHTLGQLDRVGVFGQVRQLPMAAWVQEHVDAFRRKINSQAGRRVAVPGLQG